jgi:hypothetical protein
MYVAVTRARQRLYVSCAQTRMLHGQTRYCVPSAFLDEIPANLLLKLNKKAAPVPASSFGSGGYVPSPLQAVCAWGRRWSMPSLASVSSCRPKGGVPMRAFR